MLAQRIGHACRRIASHSGNALHMRRCATPIARAAGASCGGLPSGCQRSCMSSQGSQMGSKRLMSQFGLFDSDDDDELSDEDPFASGSDEGSDGEYGELEDEALEMAEESATASLLKSAGVRFTDQEERRIREKINAHTGAGARSTEPQSVMNASATQLLDEYTDFQLRRDSFQTRPEKEYDWDNSIVPITQEDMVVRKRGGLKQAYCVFCYHGVQMLRPDNTTLLNKFISDRGKIVPRRTSNCCAKHQRKLRHVIKRARKLQLIPYNQRLHPKLRATQFMPNPETHKPVTFTTPRDALRAAQKYEKWMWFNYSKVGAPPPEVDWFPEDE